MSAERRLRAIADEVDDIGWLCVQLAANIEIVTDYLGDRWDTTGAAVPEALAGIRTLASYASDRLLRVGNQLRAPDL